MDDHADILGAPTRSYRHAGFRWRDIDGDFGTRIHAGWDILCCQCKNTVLGRLWMPFSGGHILKGSSISLDPHLVERDGPERQTGFSLRRYGPPRAMYTQRRGSRKLRSHNESRALNGGCWVYCFVCNSGQAVQPERALNLEPQVLESQYPPD